MLRIIYPTQDLVSWVGYMTHISDRKNAIYFISDINHNHDSAA
nr:MAG TPA: hypothetical protein [Bacteriophage sp.]